MRLGTHSGKNIDPDMAVDHDMARAPSWPYPTQPAIAMKFIVLIASLIVAAVLLPMLFVPPPEELAKHQARLPWNVEALPDGNSRVLGLTLNRSTLTEAKAAYGPDVEVAIVAEPGETGTLEAYVATAQLGFVTGKLVMTLAADDEQIDGMRRRAVKTEYMQSTTRRATLQAADLQAAMQLPVTAINFVPSVNLDESTVIERFGPPTERVQVNAQQTHLLYPDKGLDIVLDSEGKEVLQYVAPRDFARLSAPLTARPAARSAQ